MYRTYKNILHSFPGGFKILVKSDIHCSAVITRVPGATKQVIFHP